MTVVVGAEQIGLEGAPLKLMRSTPLRVPPSKWSVTVTCWPLYVHDQVAVAACRSLSRRS